MNPLTKDRIDTDIDIELLEQIFEDDVCTGPRKVCKAMGLKAIQYLSGNARRCGLCYRDLQDCWTIRPI